MTSSGRTAPLAVQHDVDAARYADEQTSFHLRGSATWRHVYMARRVHLAAGHVVDITNRLNELLAAERTDEVDLAVREHISELQEAAAALADASAVPGGEEREAQG